MRKFFSIATICILQLSGNILACCKDCKDCKESYKELTCHKSFCLNEKTNHKKKNKIKKIVCNCDVVYENKQKQKKCKKHVCEDSQKKNNKKSKQKTKPNKKVIEAFCVLEEVVKKKKNSKTNNNVQKIYLE